MSQRILLTVDHLYPFGDARTLFPLAKGLVDSGFDVVVVTLGQNAFEPVLWKNAGIRIFFANGDDKTPLHTARDAFYVIKELRSIIRVVEPDIVHAWCGDAIWLTMLAIQNPSLLKPLPRFRFMATELSIPNPHSFLRTMLESRFSSQMETLIVSHDTIADSMKEAGCDPSEIRVIPNGSVTSEFEPDQNIAMVDRGSESRRLVREAVREMMDLPREAKLAVAVADLVPRTRLKDLIWATDLLACIRDDFHFAIIGTGPQLAQLKRFTWQTEAWPNVHFLGQPDSPDMILSAADFYWHSHLQTPVASPLLSAMAMGIPTVSVFGPGTSEIIRHQETGLATNFGARDEFARWTKYLIEQEDAAGQLARQGQSFARSEFSVPQMNEQYLDTFLSPVVY